ncbi:MAG TPA: hypothetical protein VNJ04_04395 [Gemmatimonadaceae bacterium]|nr:hypothetical protein [Gemmatimonadaceae bacterium]
MMPAGKAAFARREEARSGIYAYEKKPVDLAPTYLKNFTANKRGWKFFQDERALGDERKA